MKTKSKWALVVLLCTAVWGATFPLMKLSMQYIPPIPFLAVRFSIGAFVLIALFWRRILAAPPSIYLHAAILGLSLYLSMALQVTGLNLTSSTNSAFLSGIYIVLIPLYTSLIKKIRLPGANIAAVLMVCVGLLLVCGVAGIEVTGEGVFFFWSMSALNFGDVLTILCSFSFGVYILASNKYVKGYDPYAISALHIVFFSAFAWIVWLLFPQSGKLSPSWDPPLIGALLITGIFGAALCYCGLIAAQRHIKPVPLVVLLSGEPVFGAVFAMLIPVGGVVESMTLSGGLGAIFVLGAILTGEVAGARRIAKREP